eukprot:m.200828 g.200828  ORF g.200828 m.200828 type:complete len:595 (+) comp13714_c0_seq2:5-1789(+)
MCVCVCVFGRETLNGPFPIVTHTQIDTGSIALDSSHTGNLIAAFENSDGLFGFVNDIAILKTGIAPTPVQFLEGEVEGVSVGINTEGFSGIVAFTTSSKGGSTCDLQVIQWIGGFEDVWTVDSFAVESKEACKVKTMKVVVADDGRSALITFAYEYEGGHGRVVAYSVTPASKTSTKDVLCCNQASSSFALADMTHFSVSSTGTISTIAYIATSSDLSHNTLVTEYYEGTDRRTPIEFELQGSAEEIASAIHPNSKNVVFVGSTGTQATVYEVESQSRLESQLVYTAPQGWVIHHPSIDFSGDGSTFDLSWRVVLQIRNLTSQRVVSCQSSGACEVVWEQSPNDVYVSAQAGPLTSIFFSKDVDNNSGRAASLYGVFSFSSHLSALNPFAVLPSSKSSPLCGINVQAASQANTASSIVAYIGTPCNAMGGATLPVSTLYFAYVINEEETGYSCSPQLQCVKNTSSPFPNEGSCASGCFGPSFQNGYTCTTNGQCVASNSAQFPTMEFCSDVCYAIPTASNTLSGGSVFLLVLIFGCIFPYLIIGMSYNIFVKKAQGTEIFPNHDFWFSTLPHNIRAGFRCVIGRRRAGDQYESI